MEQARLLRCCTTKFIICVLIFSFCSCLTPQCRDEKGEAVDWFYVYKLPRERNHLNPLVRKGVAYMHLTPSNLRGGWIMSDLAISDPLSMVGRTLAPLYQDKNTISLVYNDQPPAPEHQPDLLQSVAEMYSKSKKGQMKQASMKRYKKFKLGDKYYDDYDLAEMCKMHSKSMKTKAESGHTKGVILGEKFTSLWLVHSVPRFPPVPDVNGLNVSSYNYPATGTKYGQTFLCVSVQTSTLNQIATQLKYNEPRIVYHNIPQEFNGELPNLVDVVKNKTIDAAPWYHIGSFESLVGRKFLSFAKSAMFNDDLYSGLVAEVLQSDLLVESWTNGPGTLDSECSRNFQVRNIERLKFPIANMSFTSHHDHSKWTVAVANTTRHNSQDTKVADYWVCVGDINRALPQESRGGGTVCTSGPILWGNFAHLIESVQSWYIYKPPSDVVPFFELGRNFTFITPDSLGRWEVSDKYITSNSMLQHTLAPIFRPTYVDYLAVAIYDKRDGKRSFAGSVARGVLMADEVGGVWIYHTVPGLVNMRKDRPSFPDGESANGHVLMCLSLDLEAVNAIVHNLRNIYPRVTYLKIPEKVQHLLPEWNLLEKPLTGKNSKSLKFETRGNGLLVEVLMQRPGAKQSVYKRFASSKNIVLDVYGQTDSEYLTSICSKKYSVRNIENISLKVPESVMYLRNKRDRMWFAVSTAAHWQTQGTGPRQYWTCISNLDKEDKRGIGGDLVCVENYRVWHTFDNLKVSEPNCIQ
ncbi:uncharacterized protein LOC123873024 [Maniola jurtina]|uniref:uncharacterized protein LOC123873024 n=1 Tax=Maniola jurtina TaxID=191418 RepID=UPI001E68CC10|nr:uncharacterized protein LOC123873024 [Maniola jurtina]